MTLLLTLVRHKEYSNGTFMIMKNICIVAMIQLTSLFVGGVMALSRTTFSDTLEKVTGGFLIAGWFHFIFLNFTLAVDRLLLFLPVPRNVKVLLKRILLVMAWLIWLATLVVTLTPTASFVHCSDYKWLCWYYGSTEGSKVLAEIEMIYDFSCLTLVLLMYCTVAGILFRKKSFVKMSKTCRQAEIRILTVAVLTFVYEIVLVIFGFWGMTLLPDSALAPVIYTSLWIGDCGFFAFVTIIINSSIRGQIQRGVRQGDTISPKLFTATLEEIFRELDWEDFGININGRKLSNLRFADDIALIGNTEEELQQMVTELDEVSRRSGLKMNREKTKILATEEASILVNGEEIEQVEAFVYLGQEVRLRRDHSKEITRRIQSGWNVFRKYKDFLTSRSVLMRWKRKLFDQCVLPAMLYGSEGWNAEWPEGVTKVKDIDEAARRRKWNFAWKMANGSPEKWYNRLEEWRPPVNRPLGRPRTRWSDDLTKTLGSKRWRNRQEARGRWINMGCDNM
ncbi:hypothetical protein QR680_018015 [Steinernema hermaphroditum]|uniref:Reverse transcriptase domain-containing protein n=1 Tax=Steinernema hermaphroditum TaxID=289476 RepID=A0AA39HGL8_9BILA|nr:hypothetical protein QR680_018015 [Steinernema hermaphroditum]